MASDVSLLLQGPRMYVLAFLDVKWNEEQYNPSFMANYFKDLSITCIHLITHRCVVVSNNTTAHTYPMIRLRSSHNASVTPKQTRNGFYETVSLFKPRRELAALTTCWPCPGMCRPINYETTADDIDLLVLKDRRISLVSYTS